jgi:hypothetical protein
MARRNGKLVLIDDDTRYLINFCKDFDLGAIEKENGFSYVVHFLIHKALKAPRPLTPKERMALGGKVKGANPAKKKAAREVSYSHLGFSETQKAVLRDVDKLKASFVEEAKEEAARKVRAKKKV